MARGEPAGPVRPTRLVLERAVRLVELARRPDLHADEVADVLVEFGETPPVQISRAEVVELRGVCAVLDRLFLAPGVDAWAHGVNDLLAEWDVRPRLEHEGVGWHLHGDSATDGSWVRWFATSTALAMAVQIAETGRPVGGTCPASGCDRLFLDAGRGQPRRYCSERCASRSRVSAHRARQG